MGNPFKKSSAPPAPDYAAAASAQGQANLDVAKFNLENNRVNQFTPQGSLTWGKDANGQWTQTTTLSPQEQALYNSNNQISQQFMNTAQGGLGRVQQTMGTGFDTSQAAGYRTNLQAPNAQTLQYQNVNPNGGTPSGQVQGQLNESGVPALNGPVSDASRQRVEEAMMARAGTDMARSRGDRENQLLNSGIERGTEAWGREMDQLDRQENDMRMQAVLAGGQEESRQVGLNQSLNNQGFQQALSRGSFTNAATGQQFQQNYASNQQGYDQRLQSAQFGNQATMNQAGMDNNRMQLELALANQQNQTRGQQISEQAYLRSLPMNEINALRTGSQMTNPQFGGYATTQAQAAPIMDGAIAQGNYAAQISGQNQSGQNALMGGLANLGSAYIRYAM